ncbi:MAG: 4-hydroxy-tetrahydrodipicolinate synthase [Alphaproteobacteria bacterium]|nr:4-hydroxy-tetrahydrodipicolinate synthase [Alphaproteobacteria bacterium]
MLNGYIAAVVTPFSNEKLDLESFERYISFLSGSKISGIVVCGSTGESLSLSLNEKITLIQTAQKITNGKINLFAGVIDATTDNCVNFIKKTEDMVNGFLCICPFYIKPSQSQIYEHFKIISESTKKDIILYNNPGRVGTSIEFPTLKKLSTQKNIIAIKECSSDLSVFTTYRNSLKENFAFLSGNDDTACAALAMGASGVISVTANIAPDLCATAYSSFKQGNFERFGVVRDALEPLHKLMFAEPSPAPVKYALSKLGLIKNELRMPLSPISEQLKAKIDKIIHELNLEKI